MEAAATGSKKVNSKPAKLGRDVQARLGQQLRAMKGAENKFAAIEDLTDEELEKLHEECRERAQVTLDHLEGRKRPTSGTRRTASRTRTAAQRSKTSARASS